jgi:prepilin signal peptidase PulO-like enzyme (type II secretory pathway)
MTPPDPSRDDGLASIREKARLDAEAATTLNARAVEATNVKWGRDQDVASEAGRNDIDKLFQQSVLDVAQGGVDRSRSAAQFVQQAAAAIVTLYAGILAVSFSATGRVLPIRGIFPAFFLALSIATATAYVAFMTSPRPFPIQPLAGQTVPERMMWRVATYLQFVGEYVNRRASWLRASVVSLAVGVLFLPAPFVAFSVTPADLAPYPWPSPPTVSDQPTASIDSILYSAQVSETAAARQRAQAAQNLTADLGLWLGLAGLGLIVLVAISASYPWDRPNQVQAAPAQGAPPGGLPEIGAPPEEPAHA